MSGQRDTPPDEKRSPPGRTYEAVCATWGDGIVLYHPDVTRMGSEWIESDAWIEDVTKHN